MSYFIYGSVALEEPTNLLIHLLLLGFAPAGWFAVSLGVLGAVTCRPATTEDRRGSRSSRLRVRSLPGSAELWEQRVGYLISVLVWIYLFP